jgi:hypothetical protein
VHYLSGQHVVISIYLEMKVANVSIARQRRNQVDHPGRAGFRAAVYEHLLAVVVSVVREPVPGSMDCKSDFFTCVAC